MTDVFEEHGVFDKHGNYKEGYGNELSRYRAWFLGKFKKPPDLTNYLNHTEYKEFIELDSLKQNLKPFKKGKNMGRPKKIKNTTPIKEVVQVQSQVQADPETTIIQDVVESDIVVNATPTDIKKVITKKFNIRNFDSLGTHLDLMKAFVTTLLHLNRVGIIKLNKEEIHKLSQPIINVNKMNLLVLQILFVKFSEKGIFELTHEEYKALTPDYQKDYLTL